MVINTEDLSTVSECLEQLVVAEQIQISIEHQISQPNENKDWEKRAERALQVVKNKRRIITAHLAVLRQRQKELNVKMCARANDLLVKELKQVVPLDVYLQCEQRAREAAQEVKDTDGR
ncbi:hypothetical protein [Enterobacter ludwigii]|uniref:hypothetical protein n=1 Tax=Enterobacter ludwigii TaxID=299767 RepID=UPI00307679B8